MEAFINASRPQRYLFHVSLLLICCLVTSLAAQSTGRQRYNPTRVIVKFHDSQDTVPVSSAHGLSPLVQTPLAQDIISRMDVQMSPSDVQKEISSQAFVFKITDGASVEEKLAQLRSMPQVALAEPDYEVELYRIPDDPGYTQQWHLPRIGSGVAWDTFTGSKAVKVCVVDSGVRQDHPDLKDNIAMGWNVVHTDTTAAPMPGDPQFTNYTDTLGHGTHVSGLIAAIGNNELGVAGVSWRASILACKFISDSGSGYISDAIACLKLCRAQGAHVYSNSWGGVDFNQAVLSEIQAIEQAGGLFVTAAGNDNANLDTSPMYPASYNAPNQLTVAASTPSDSLADFSNYGPKTVHIEAPGVLLLSTTNDLDYGLMSGTSMAAPVVAGAAALLQAASMNLYNTVLTPRRLKRLLMSSAAAIPDGSKLLVSGGRVDIGQALAALKLEMMYGVPPDLPSPPPSPPIISTPPPTSNANTSVGIILAPRCGTSPLKGQPAVQSSTLGKRTAGKAVDGDCRSNMTKKPNICAVTDPTRSNPWWTAPLAQQSQIFAVSLSTRSDCCWSTIGGAIVLVGNTTWTGSGSRPGFTECGTVPDFGIPRGQRMTIKCAQPILGSTVVVFLPKSKTSLVLCEVDVTLGAIKATPNPSSSSGSSPIVQPQPPLVSPPQPTLKPIRSNKSSFPKKKAKKSSLPSRG